MPKFNPRTGNWYDARPLNPKNSLRENLVRYLNIILILIYMKNNILVNNIPIRSIIKNSFNNKVYINSLIKDIFRI